MGDDAGGKRNGARASLAAGFIGLLLGAAGLVLYDQEPLPPDEIRPPTLIGKPLRLSLAAGDRVYLLLDQQVRHWFWGRSSTSRALMTKAQEMQYHTELLAFELPGGRLLWRRRFEHQTPGVMASAGELLTAQGGVLVIGLPEPRLVSAMDGSDAPAPAAADIVRGGEVHDLRDVQERGWRSGDRWLGLLTAEESKKLLADTSGQWRPDAVGAPGADAAYALWTARVRDVQEAWGKRATYSGYQRLDALPEFHQAGLLTPAQRADVIVLPDPESVLVLHRATADAAGLALSRVATGAARVLWQARLVQTDIQHLMGGPQDLVVVGPGPAAAATTAGQPSPARAQVISFINLQSGTQADVVIGDLALRPGPEAAD